MTSTSRKTVKFWDKPHTSQPTASDLSYKNWKHLIPFRPSSKDPRELPLVTAGLFSFATTHWATQLVAKALRRDLTREDLYETPWAIKAENSADRFQKIWREEIATHGKEKASVTRAILKMIKYRLLLALLMTFALTALDIIGPAVFVLNILRALGQDDKLTKIPWNAALLIVCLFTKNLLLNSTFIVNFLTGMQVKGGVLSCTFKKVLSDQIPGQTVGQLVNLCSNDGQRLYEACMLGVFSFAGVVSMAGAISIILVLGPWGILGFAIFFTFLPLQTYLSRLIYKLRSKVVPITDERVRIMSEVINSIKLVKMYAWEKPFAKKIHDIRAKEKATLTNSLIVQSVSNGLTVIIPLTASTLTFVAMTLTNQELTATKAFLFITILNALRFTIGVMPFSNKALSEAINACNRLKKVLIVDEEKAEIVPLFSTSNVVEIRQGCFGWPTSNNQAKDDQKGQKKVKATKNLDANANDAKHELEPLNANSEENSQKDISNEGIISILKDINLSIKEGTLIGVCGSVGSGKTSLISAILNMMSKTHGELAVDESKTIAYVPQQAWIMNTTVRENILFGKDYNSAKYQAVVEACALGNDFVQFTAGDQTEIGERGVNLSGGQKQRISIARAVYSESDIILLDDPLSAVDAHVGQQIFEKCISEALKSKTVLFVTHQLQFLQDCNYIIVMKDGRIKEEGTHGQLMGMEDGEYNNLIKTFYESSSEEKLSRTTSTCTSIADAVLPTRQRSSSSRYLRSTSARSHKSDSQPKTDVTHSAHDLCITPQLSVPEPFRRRASTGVSNHSGGRDRHSKAIDSPLVEAFGGSLVDISAELSDNGDIIDDLVKESQINADDNQMDPMKGKLTKSEKIQTGSVKAHTYWKYIKAAGGLLPAILVISAVFIYIAVTVFSNYWLSLWINDGSGASSHLNGKYTNMTNVTLNSSLLANPKLHMYRLVYSMCLIASTALLVIKSVSYMKVSLNASSSLHNKLFNKVVSSPMKFFDITPCGQILNRFSRDVDEADSMLPFTSELVVVNLSQTIASIVIISVVFYYFLIALIPITILFLILYKICLKAVRDSKRIENVTRSPLYSHITTTMQGLATIRAYKKEEYFYGRFNKMQDTTNMAMFLFQSCMRWASFRLDLLSIAVVLTTTLLMTFVADNVVQPAYMALALSYAIRMTGLFQFTVRTAIDVQARFLSVERVQDYIEDLESEAPPVIKSSSPNANWPKDGAIEFNDVGMRYRDGLPLVLRNISIKIKAQEKIGIVGRTGSGKSSVGLVLFRIVELASGSITIDDVDISKIGLHELRSRLSIIPQDPVLFIGSVRYNLDPFDQYDDASLWEALEKCHIKSSIVSLPEKLNTTVIENGENFSVGERQLLCMARALLRHSKILVLDEATAAIDTETDALIQTTIKEAFTNCTMLTIAHRLNTVMSYDKIMVLDDGEVIEFDSPSSLLAKKTSVFAQMVQTQESQKINATNTS